MTVRNLALYLFAVGFFSGCTAGFVLADYIFFNSFQPGHSAQTPR